MSHCQETEPTAECMERLGVEVPDRHQRSAYPKQLTMQRRFSTLPRFSSMPTACKWLVRAAQVVYFSLLLGDSDNISACTVPLDNRGLSKHLLPVWPPHILNLHVQLVVESSGCTTLYTQMYKNHGLWINPPFWPKDLIETYAHSTTCIRLHPLEEVLRISAEACITSHELGSFLKQCVSLATCYSTWILYSRDTRAFRS